MYFFIILRLRFTTPSHGRRSRDAYCPGCRALMWTVVASTVVTGGETVALTDMLVYRQRPATRANITKKKKHKMENGLVHHSNFSFVGRRFTLITDRPSCPSHSMRNGKWFLIDTHSRTASALAKKYHGRQKSPVTNN